MKKIDFKELGGPVFVGRERGNRVREKFNLDQIDTSDEKIQIIVPEDTYSINPSFFLALFGKSIRTLGDKEAFFKKYEIKAPEHILESIVSMVSRVLIEKKILLDEDK